MTSASPARSRGRRTRRGAAALAAGAALVAVLTPSPLRDLGLRSFDAAVQPDVDPSLGRLDPDLRAAFEQAQRDARDAGVELHLNSGWRSPEHQERLLREAVHRYGSEEEAARWVATPTTSPHVSGDAVDVGPPAAAAWLGRHGDRHGLCRVYDNEPWHFELRSDAAQRGCPATYDDPTQDPRMR